MRATRDAVDTARSAVSGDVPTAVARRRVGAIEHEGDRRRAELIAILSGTFASPIDREDLFRTSRSVDDVLDNLRDFVREHDLFELGPQPLLLDVLDAVADGVEELYIAASAISEDPRRMRAASLAARKNHIRVRYQLAMVDLLSGDVTAEMLRCRELLRRLDIIGLRLGEAADALADGAVKRSH